MKRFVVFERTSFDKHWIIADSFDEREFAEMCIKLKQARNRQYESTTQHFYHISEVDLPEILEKTSA